MTVKDHLAPQKWYQKSDVRVLLWGILFLALLSLFHTRSHVRVMTLFVNQSEAETRRLAENLRTSVLKLIQVAEEGGGFIDDYIDSLDLSGGTGVRIIHSPSIDAEYGVEAEESPRLQTEHDALADGLPRQREKEDFHYYLIPLQAEERCRSCHHLPDGSGEPVPAGYSLGLLEVKVPMKALREAKEETYHVIFQTTFFLCLMVGFFLFGIFRILRELREREEIIRDISASAQDAILMMDEGGRITFWNRAAEKIFGYSREEVLYKNLHDLIAPPRFHDAFQKGLGAFQRTGEGPIIGKTSEFPALRKDGKEFAAEHSISAVKIKGKWCAIGIVRDATGRKKMVETLKERNAKLKKTVKDLEKARDLLVRQEKLASVGTLAAGVAHEILNPLNIISATVQIMQMEEATEEQKENFREIMNQIHRAVKISNSLRMFSHQVQPEIREVDLNALFERTVSLMEYDLSLENIIVERNGDPSIPLVKGDEDLLAQVFMNLLTNARDAMRGGKGNRIIYHSRKVRGGIEIRISDTGPGIPEAIREQIFDPFFTTKDPNQGTGLGLSVLHSIITEKHGGTVRVESEEGKGAEFVITLPAKGS